MKTKKGSVATREDILNYHKAPKATTITVPGFDKEIRVEPLTDSKFYEIREVTQGDRDAFNAAVVASVCTDLELSDARALQKNGMRFVVLYQAVMGYLGVLTDDNVKK